MSQINNLHSHHKKVETEQNEHKVSKWKKIIIKIRAELMNRKKIENNQGNKAGLKQNGPLPKKTQTTTTYPI